MFLKLPRNQKNQETKDFTTDFLAKIDAMLSTTKFKEAVLGGKNSKIHLPAYLSDSCRGKTGTRTQTSTLTLN